MRPCRRICGSGLKRDDSTRESAGRIHAWFEDAGHWIIVAARPIGGQGAGFPEQADQADRAVSAGRPERHHRARGRAAHVRDSQAAAGDRQSRRTGRRTRNRCGREGRTRWLYHRYRQREFAGHQPDDGQGRLRRPQGFCAGDAGDDSAGNAGGGDQRSRQEHGRAGRARQGAARKTQFCLRRYRRPAASGGRIVQADGQDRHRARALSGCCARHQRSPGTAGADDVPRPAGDPAADQGRPAAADRARRAGARRPPRPTCRPPRRSACRTC